MTWLDQLDKLAKSESLLSSVGGTSESPYRQQKAEAFSALFALGEPLTPVLITGAVANDTLRYDGAKWVNSHFLQNSDAAVMVGAAPPASGIIRLDGALAISGVTGLAAGYGATFALAGGGGSPNSGRLFIGDGTGWQFNFSRRVGSVTTDLFRFKDSGELDVLTGPAVIGTDPGGSQLLRVGGAGRFSGNVTIAKTSPVYVADDTGAASDPLTLAYISFQRAGVEKGWMGFGDGASSLMRIRNTIGELHFSTSGGEWFIGTTGQLTPVSDNSEAIGDSTHRIQQVYTRIINLFDDVTNGNPYINFTWKNSVGTGRQGYLEATQDSVRLYSGSLGGQIEVWNFATGVVINYGARDFYNASGVTLLMSLTNGGALSVTGGGQGSFFYAIGFTRSAGNAAFPDVFGDGTNALVIAGKNDGTGIIKLGTIGSNLLFTDNTFDIGAAGANRPKDIYIAGNLTAGGTVTATDVKLRLSNVTAVGTGAATIETDLMTHVLPTLANGDTIEVICSGSVTGVANTKQIRLYISGNVVTLNLAAGTTGAWFFRASVVKDGVTSHYVILQSPATLAATAIETTILHAGGGDLSTATVKVTGLTVNAADEVTQERMTIVIQKA